MIDRRTFLGMGVSAFASVGVPSAFALDDRQQWYEPEVTGEALLNMPVMEGFKPTVLAYHIPFYTQDLAEYAVKDVQTTPNHWARNILRTMADLNSGWLAACPGKGDQKINTTLAEWLPKQKNLKALLCGHKHFEYRTQFCENVTQYICGATFKGNAYHITFT